MHHREPGKRPLSEVGNPQKPQLSHRHAEQVHANAGIGRGALFRDPAAWCSGYLSLYGTLKKQRDLRQPQWPPSINHRASTGGGGCGRKRLLCSKAGGPGGQGGHVWAAEAGLDHRGVKVDEQRRAFDGRALQLHCLQGAVIHCAILSAVLPRHRAPPLLPFAIASHLARLSLGPLPGSVHQRVPGALRWPASELASQPLRGIHDLHGLDRLAILRTTAARLQHEVHSHGACPHSRLAAHGGAARLGILPDGCR
mmetsp:Transcript_29214/g.82432  ORF Transcript_29214/g.82432 Transcript_29214/m.82432 type:complete len:254 (-) Transcript_29214:313-1074(-)